MSCGPFAVRAWHKTIHLQSSSSGRQGAASDDHFLMRSLTRGYLNGIALNADKHAPEDDAMEG
jgi:hypothetical protein